MKTNSFNFIPAIKLMELYDEHNLMIVTFFSTKGNYMTFNNVDYITWDGCHVATKNGSKITWNANATLPKGFKKAAKYIRS